MKFDYQMPAELFMAKRKGGPQRLGYRRFVTAAEAIRFAVEEFPPIHTLGAYTQVGDERFDKQRHPSPVGEQRLSAAACRVIRRNVSIQRFQGFATVGSSIILFTPSTPSYIAT
jgi:hypothetical protein